MSALCECDLSIIIPVYNLENYIMPMLDSLSSQVGDFKAEYIFVMNNCTDRSEEIIRANFFSPVILQCYDQGCGCARNVGLEHAHGEYVWFLDGDDWLLANDAIKTVLEKAKGLDILRIPYKSNSYYGGYFSMVWQYVFRREFIKEFRFRQTQPAEDDEWTRQVLQKAGLHTSLFYNLPTVDRPLYYYNYLREGSNMWRVRRGEDINSQQN